MLQTFNGIMKEIMKKTKTHSFIDSSPDDIGTAVITTRWKPYLKKVHISRGGFAAYLHRKKTIDQMFFFRKSIVDLAMSGVWNRLGQTFLYFICRFAPDLATDLLLQLHTKKKLTYGQINEIQCKNSDTPQIGSMWGCKQNESTRVDDNCRLVIVLWVLGANMSDAVMIETSRECKYIPIQPSCKTEEADILGFINDNISKYINVKNIPLLEDVPDVFETSFVDIVIDTFDTIEDELRVKYNVSLQELAQQKQDVSHNFKLLLV
jgi:hypothetical protein